MTNPQNFHHAAFDLGALTLILGNFVGLLGPIAAGLAALWYCILIYDRLFGKGKS